MPNRIVLHPAFADDLEAVIDYIEQHTATSAEEFKQLVYATLTELATMPGAGSLKSFRGPQLTGIRSWSVRGFRRIPILYRPLDDGISVIAIYYGARNIPALLRRRLRNPPHQ